MKKLFFLSLIVFLTFGPAAGAAQSPISESEIGSISDSIHNWLVQNQNNNPSGLVVSHPDDANFVYHNGIPQDWAKVYANTQGYTYDQALAGMSFLDHGDLINAKKIFDFYDSERELEQNSFNGFWTVYNVNPELPWKKYEWRKGMGETAWIGLFAVRYACANTGPENEKGLRLALEAAKWISKLPHTNGAVAMSPDNPGGAPNFGRIYSVENNLDYYSLLKSLLNESLEAPDKQWLTDEFNHLKSWLRQEGVDAKTGLFRTGGELDPASGQITWDITQSLDVNSWAIATIGPAILKNEWGIDMNLFAARIAQTFSVQPDGKFGGYLLNAKGFDFADANNASAIGRSGIKWVEGTNQMILAYKILSDYFRLTDLDKANYFKDLADYFANRNAGNSLTANGGTSCVYTDKPGVQIYKSTKTWFTSTGRSVPSSVWVYLALNKINPFVSPGENNVTITGQPRKITNDLYIVTGYSNQLTIFDFTGKKLAIKRFQFTVPLGKNPIKYSLASGSFIDKHTVRLRLANGETYLLKLNTPTLTPTLVLKNF